MEKSKKRKNIRTSDSYVALKSENELYYQMASILKEATRDENDWNEDKMIKEIFNEFFTKDQSKGSMEKFRTFGRSIGIM